MSASSFQRALASQASLFWVTPCRALYLIHLSVHNVVYMCVYTQCGAHVYVCVIVCVCVEHVCVHTCVSGGTSNKYTTLSKDYLSNMCSNIGKALHWGFPSILGFPLEAGGQPPSTPPCGVYKECWLLCSFSTQRAWGT